ncbi:MAG: site-specific DNA-methyltransferase, partial [Planctomycetaceae bacterium]
MTATHHVLIGDCRESMRSLPAGSVHCVVTSPPYWALRDYGVDGQLGLENTPEEYVAGMVDVFREVWRVLRDDGTLWLNIGDSYNNAGSSRNGEGLDGTRRGGATGPDGQCGYKQRDLRHALKDHGIKHKDLVGIP